MKPILFVAAAAAALSMAATAGATSPASTSRHDRDVIRFFTNHPELARTPAGARALWRIVDHLESRLRTLQAARASPCGQASPAACAWYLDGATQCEVAHEGNFTSVSPDGIYAGRFQADSSFEASTELGKRMQAQYGRASNWPPWAQIEHAYEVWTVRGWSPWPPYYRYGCAAYHGGAYT